jgi:hypothetical protein
MHRRPPTYGRLSGRSERTDGGSHEGHIWFHVLAPNQAKNSPQAEAAEQLIDVVRSYLK